MKMTKAQARKRLSESVEKISKVLRAGYLTPAQWVKLTEPIIKHEKRLK